MVEPTSIQNSIYGGERISIFTPKKYVNFLYVLFTSLNKIYTKTWNYYDFIRVLLSGVCRIDHVKLYNMYIVLYMCMCTTVSLYNMYVVVYTL